MGDNGRRRPPRRGDNLRKRLSDLERSHGETSRQVKVLTDCFNIKDNAAGVLAEWIGKSVELETVAGKVHVGELKFVDKYNFGVLLRGSAEVSVFPKTNIERVTPTECVDEQ